MSVMFGEGECLVLVFGSVETNCKHLVSNSVICMYLFLLFKFYASFIMINYFVVLYIYVFVSFLNYQFKQPLSVLYLCIS